MWLIYALLTTLSWAFADLFYKHGAVPADKFSHIKTVIMVGLVMGLHGFAFLLINEIAFSPLYLLTYFPVSFLYILSMAIGYYGLRYIELSISSPVQNSSGAVTAILIFLFFAHTLSVLQIGAISLITLGIVLLAAIDKRRAGKSLILSDEDKNYRK